MKMSETITELAGALAKAQGQIEDASKGSENPYFKSRYADLAKTGGEPFICALIHITIPFPEYLQRHALSGLSLLCCLE